MPDQDTLMSLGVPAVLARRQGFIISLAGAGVGTTQAGATLIPSQSIFEAKTITGASAEAFVLGVPHPGDVVFVYNTHATAAAKVFPNSGAHFCPGAGGAVSAADAVYSLAALKNAMFVAVSNTVWFVIVT